MYLIEKHAISALYQRLKGSYIGPLKLLDTFLVKNLFNETEQNFLEIDFINLSPLLKFTLTPEIKNIPHSAQN